jgi:acyl-CoA dehydrogenase
VLAGHAADVDRASRFPTEAMAALRESGLMGLLVPESHGGLGGDLASLAEVASRLAGGCLSTAMIWAMHCQQVDTLVRFARPELARTLLPRIADGSVYVASVTSEQGKGGHLLSAVAPLIVKDDRLIIERHAPVVTGGRYADGYLITMRGHESAPRHQVSLVYAERDQLEVEVLGEWHALGMRGTDSVPLRLTGEVPAAQLVGDSGSFRVAALESFIPCGHIAWAACWLGAARAALVSFVALLRSPRRPSGVDPKSDLVAERLARARLPVELVSAYLGRVIAEISELRAAGSTMDDPATQIHLNLLKVAASELSVESLERLINVAGLPLGYLEGSPIPLERNLRDLRSASLNYANDRLLVATGMLTWLDRAVRLV